MSVQTEKSILIDLLQNISDVSILKKVKQFVLKEIEQGELTDLQKQELNNRLEEHQKNPKSGVDAFEFLDSIKTKYEL
ncbi:hypothetical protein M0M57_06170 [Flavobacterium azooxidireducens]|uniref:Addiction module component n=1 Tax=Flavobacterium azooxidireducens TaxID=1871076 RepID=A0ABY4KIB2_9FLAO|nr:hypothetical protein [Flavobacterium azooxidireducens]UPQ80419.1 hypothetical protein M0M57_06170 [Flavobacterium azooxidireducens]